MTINIPSGLFKCSETAISIWLRSHQCDEEDFKFEKLMSLGGKGRDVTRRAMKELKKLGLAELKLAAADGSYRAGRKWVIKKSNA